jgi:alanyl-tRNA synthetase
LPSSTGAGYVIRRILRRAGRYGYSYLGFETPFLNELVPTLADKFADVFPELKSQQDFVANVIREEEASFFKTLSWGIHALATFITEGPFQGSGFKEYTTEEFENHLKKFPVESHPKLRETYARLLADNELYKKKIIPGHLAFFNYDTHGFPYDLTSLIATEKGFTIDEDGFKAAMKKQKELGKADAATEQSDWVSVGEDVKTDFIGYDYNEADAHVVKYRSVKQKDKELYQIVLDKTPFYAESGGQVGDTGYLDFGGEKIDVLDTKKENDLIVHFVKQLPKQVDATAHAKINERRRADTVKNHSATHLLQSALRQVLGTHVQQKGSLVNSDYLRFDFSHFSKMTDDEIAQVERIVNEKIMENIPLDERRNVPIADAEKLGATMLFGEKYGEFVRVITFDEKFSRELCGGTHVKSTGEIGLFKIISEASVAAGVRRIEALTGKNALQYVDAKLHELNTIAATFKGAKSVSQAVANLQEQAETLRKENEQLQDKIVAGLAKQLKTESERLVNNHFIAKTGVEVTSADALRKLGILLVNDLKDNFVILLSAHINGKYLVHLRIAPGLGINGNALLKEIAPSIKGGGPADFVQASAANGNEVEELCKKLHEKFNS